MQVTNKTQLNMVIGYPLEHSQSPVLHAVIYQHIGLDAVMLAQPRLHLRSLIQAIKTLNVELTAVTLPYKEKIIPYLDELSPEVKALKAANTVIQKKGKLIGYNTDIDGIAYALQGVNVRGKDVLVVGAGGAARALGYFLKKQRAHIYWMNRTKMKALVLAKAFGGQLISQDEVNEYEIDIIINTTPIGMYPKISATPLPHYQFNSKQVVFDMVYNPVNTMLLRQAISQKAKIVSGLDMFIGQGLRQVELLTGKKMDSPVMIKTLRKMLMHNQRPITI